jgi:hypothetical protein
MPARQKPPKAVKVNDGRKRDDPEQSRLFIEKAREVSADEEKSAADVLMGQLAKLPPEPRTKSKAKIT